MAAELSARERLPGSSRYELLHKIASGGMATVYLGRLRGPAGFSRIVAIKRAHPHLFEDATSRRSLISEARLHSRIQHPNVVSVHDIEDADGELLIAMDYIEGAALSELLMASIETERVLSARIAIRIVLDVCDGLQAAHELKDDDGRLLGIVHRDVSPQNVLVGVDGVSRVADFGIAKANHGPSTTTTGALKGKLAYMAPEYVEGRPADSRSDVFALGVVLWEAIANQRCFRAANEADTLRRILSFDAPPISSVVPNLGHVLDRAVARALEKSPALRYGSAKEMGLALGEAARAHDLVATREEVGRYVLELVGDALGRRRRRVNALLDAAEGRSHAQGAGTSARRSEAKEPETALMETRRWIRDAAASSTPESAPALRDTLRISEPESGVAMGVEPEPLLGKTAIMPKRDSASASAVALHRPRKRRAVWWAGATLLGVAAALVAVARRPPSDARGPTTSNDLGAAAAESPSSAGSTVAGVGEASTSEAAAETAAPAMSTLDPPSSESAGAIRPSPSATTHAAATDGHRTASSRARPANPPPPPKVTPAAEPATASPSPGSPPPVKPNPY